jgi:hypothetical protein
LYTTVAAALVEPPVPAPVKPGGATPTKISALMMAAGTSIGVTTRAAVVTAPVVAVAMVAVVTTAPVGAAAAAAAGAAPAESAAVAAASAARVFLLWLPSGRPC